MYEGGTPETPDGRRDAQRRDQTERQATATQTRRDFLRTAAAGSAAAVALGGGMLGTASGLNIPTPVLHRDGNLIRDPNGNKVILRGVNIADPARLNDPNMRYHVTAEKVIDWATAESDGWYNRIIRLPSQSGDIVGSGANAVAPGEMTEEDVRTYVDDHLRPAVDRCAQRNVYAIVDYHRHSMSQVKYTDEALHEEVQMFWNIVAPEFADDDHVLFEVYNEPIAPYPGHNEYGSSYEMTGSAAEEAWLTWREAAQPWVDTIREHDPQSLILVGSPRWSQFTYWAPRHEFEGDNLAYVGHVYAHPNLRPLDKYFGKPGEKVPVFITEFGFDDEGQDYIKGTKDVHGQQFLDLFENYPLHWQVWCFDPRWEPAMFSEDQGVWTLRDGPGFHGKLFKDYLEQKRNDDLPFGGGETTPTDGTPTTTSESGGPSWPTDPAATDPDADGHYEDLTGNGEIDNQDVVQFFENMGTQDDPGPMAQNGNLAYYDYSGNEAIDYQDLIQLFGEI